MPYVNIRIIRDGATAEQWAALPGVSSATLYEQAKPIPGIIGGSFVGDSLAVNKLLKTGRAMRSLVRWPPSV